MKGDIFDELFSYLLDHDPKHGINCACMDAWIRRLRIILTVNDPKVQARIDYIVRQAVDR